MSFSHRVAFYDKNTDSIKYPGKQQCYAYMDGFGYPVESDYSSIDRTSRYIPLASTGLEDSEGNEIFEGHILTGETKLEKQYGDDIINRYKHVMEWSNGGFRLGQDSTSSHPISYVERSEIVGHALTDPDLVPESFDVDEYFGLEEDNDS